MGGGLEGKFTLDPFQRTDPPPAALDLFPFN